MRHGSLPERKVTLRGHPGHAESQYMFRIMLRHEEYCTKSMPWPERYFPDLFTASIASLYSEFCFNPLPYKKIFWKTVAAGIPSLLLLS